jgi:hypothetical protein
VAERALEVVNLHFFSTNTKPTRTDILFFFFQQQR